MQNRRVLGAHFFRSIPYAFNKTLFCFLSDSQHDFIREEFDHCIPSTYRYVHLLCKEINHGLGHWELFVIYAS
jgi:hypothetical protein